MGGLGVSRGHEGVVFGHWEWMMRVDGEVCARLLACCGVSQGGEAGRAIRGGSNERGYGDMGRVTHSSGGCTLCSTPRCLTLTRRRPTTRVASRFARRTSARWRRRWLSELLGERRRLVGEGGHDEELARSWRLAKSGGLWTLFSSAVLLTSAVRTNLWYLTTGFQFANVHMPDGGGSRATDGVNSPLVFASCDRVR